MNYQIIKDIDELKKFIAWLPELSHKETYYCSLFARSKYSDGEVKSDKAQLKRFTSKKEYLIDKIRQLEVQKGIYKSNGNPIPEKSLALYINPNPRDLEKATKNGLIEFAKKITEPYNGYNPRQLIMTAIHKSFSKKHFMDFDFDGVDYEYLMGRLYEVINMECINVLETRGGYHVLVEMQKIEDKYKKTWYNSIKSINGSDVIGDNLIPVAGCIQGNYIPKLVYGY